MKDKPNTDEMLNAYVDGELNTRQKTEFQRLLGREEPLATQVQKLEQLKQLVGSLPREEAPDDIADQVLDILERKTLLGERKVVFTPANSFRHRILRRVNAIAAMLVLFAALSGLIYSIVAPTPSTDISKVTTVRDFGILRDVTPDVQLAGTWTLQGDSMLLSQINQCLKESGFSGLVDVAANGSRYTELECSRLELNRLAQQINQDCLNLAGTRLMVYALAGQQIDPVEISWVQPRQIAILLDVADANEGNQLASNMSVENDLNPLNSLGSSEMLPIPSLTETVQSNHVRIVLIWDQSH